MVPKKTWLQNILPCKKVETNQVTIEQGAQCYESVIQTQSSNIINIKSCPEFDNKNVGYTHRIHLKINVCAMWSVFYLCENLIKPI